MRLRVSKTIGGSKNGGKREVPSTKAPKFYPADEVVGKTPSAREAASKGVAKLRKSLTPGTIVIMLAGRFRGRRAVFLKQLASGLLVQRGDGSRPVRLVLQGRPATIGRPNVDTETEATTALSAGDVVSKLVHTLSHTTSAPFELPPEESMPQQNKTPTGVHWLAR